MTPSEFWAKVRKTEDCWLWMGTISVSGYGSAHVRGVDGNAAHRVAYTLHTQTTIPYGVMVCHHCDNKQCVNPAHLYLGTAADNGRDRAKRPRGKPSTKIVIYKMKQGGPLRRGVGWGGPSKPSKRQYRWLSYETHLTCDGTFGLCGHPLLFIDFDIIHGKHYGTPQGVICTHCLSLANARYPNSYDVVRKVPE